MFVPIPIIRDLFITNNNIIVAGSNFFLFMPHILFSWVELVELHAAEKGTIPAQSHQISGTLKTRVFEFLSSPSGSLMCFGL
jgi:hypothetical protein